MYEKEWRKTITNLLVPECGYYYLVYDPDYLLGDERIYLQLKEKGFELLTYTGEIDFRLLFEEKIRTYTDRSVQRELIILVQSSEGYTYIPHDLVIKSVRVSIDLAGLLPTLDPEVLRELPITLLDTLYSIETYHSQRRLSYDESRDFILRLVYGLDPLLIRTEVQLLRFLLHIHYDRPEIPESLLRFMSEYLSQRNEFKAWNIKNLLHDRAAFFRFLEEQLNRKDAGNIPLEQSEIKVYLDNVIEDGLVYVNDSGAGFGMYGDRAGKADELRLKKSIRDLSTALPATYAEWLSFMGKWASVTSSIYTVFHPDTHIELFTLLNTRKRTVNDRFEEWLRKSYGSLYNHPPSSPVMLHHLPRYLLQSVASGKKIALLVIDGLSVSQWKVIRAALDTHAGFGGYSIDEKALFAWIPTLTSVSRQALLSGKFPLSISRFLHDTGREEKLWKNFWEDNDIVPEKVGYRKIQGDSTELDEISGVIDQHFQVSTLIVNKIDSIMHGQKQGSAMMHKEVKHWADSAFISDLLDILFRRYDDIFLTSDHGNDEATGIGTFSQGSLIKEKGQRCRIYDSSQFRNEAQVVYADSIRWPQIGLPENYYPLLAAYGTAFTKEGTRVVTHGGSSIDEVIVPFIHFSKGEKKWMR